MYAHQHQQYADKAYHYVVCSAGIEAYYKGGKPDNTSHEGGNSVKIQHTFCSYL